MSAVTNYRNLTRLLAGKDRRTIHFGQFSPLTVEKIEEAPLISLRHQSAGEDKNAPSTEVVFLVQGDTARAVYFQNETVEQATVPELFPRVMVAPQFQRILDRFVSDSWRDLENRGYFAVAEDMAMAKEKRGRLYFGKPAPDPALLHQALPTEKASPPIHTSTNSLGEPQVTTEKAEAQDIYQRVTDHIRSSLENNPGEWRRPWHKTSVLPVNASSQRHYAGINVISLWATAQVKGYESGKWATYQGWKELGAQVKKGEKASPVVFFKDISKEGETTEGKEEEAEGQEREGRKRRFVAKGYWVFNAAQVDGYKPPEIPKLPESERIKRAEDFFVGVGADIRHGGNQAFYNRASDHIQMPAFGVFHSAEHYYSCVAHELCQL